MKRRTFFKFSIFTASILFSSKIEASFLQNIKSKKIVILGAGFAGLSAAKYLKELDSNLNVTLIEKNINFISCPFSNAWLGDLKDISFEDLNFDYNSSISKYKYNFLNEEVININRDKKQVITSNNLIEYDFLIMTLGISYNYKKLFKKNKEKIIQAKTLAPAGLKPGSETIKLKRMIREFKGGNFILTLPKSSYKCPPAPYERACMIAHYFKENKIDAKVIIIDPRAKPASKHKAYLEVFNTIYKDYIIYKNKTNFIDVDFENKKALVRYFHQKSDSYKKEKFDFEEISIIPPNKAHQLYKKAGIKTYAQGWVKLKRPSFRTINDDDIYVFGDAQGEYPYPKSAQMANSSAYIVANDIIFRINNKKFDYTKNLPGNICYSILSENTATWVSHDYEYKDKLNIYVNTSPINTNNYHIAKAWYKDLTSDLFALKGVK